MMALDYKVISNELDSTSPQALLVRELYAAASVDAAARGIRVPYLDPLVHALNGTSPEPIPLRDIFDDNASGQLFASSDSHLGNELFALSKGKSNPDDYSERQMRGPEWDEPKQSEIAKIERLNAKTDIAADDPSIQHLQVCDFMWVGKDKRDASGNVKKKNARAVGRGDKDHLKTTLTSNDTMYPSFFAPFT